MNNRQLQKAWQEVSLESINTPRVKTPYSPDIALTRELLLYAQVILGKIEQGKKSVFYEGIYKKIMAQYYKQKAWLNI